MLVLGDSMSNKEIKSVGKELIHSNRLKALFIGAVSMSATALFTVISFFLYKLPLNRIAICAIALLVIISYFIFKASLSFVKKAWYSGKLMRKKTFKRVLYWIIPSHSFKAFRFHCLLFSVKFLWSAVTLLPSFSILTTIIILAYSGGIELYLFVTLISGFVLLLISGLIFRFIIVQRYFLAEHLITLNPKLKPVQAIRQSISLSNGHIKEIISFKLSFLPWIISAPFIFPFLYFIPYYKQSCSVIAKSICL